MNYLNDLSSRKALESHDLHTLSFSSFLSRGLGLLACLLASISTT